MHVQTQCSSQEAFSFFRSNLLVLGINPVILGSFLQFAAKLPCKYQSENHSKEPPNFCTVHISSESLLVQEDTTTEEALLERLESQTIVWKSYTSLLFTTLPK